MGPKFKLFISIFAYNILLSLAMQNDECSRYKSLWFSYKYPYTDGLMKMSSTKAFKNVCISSKCCDGTVQNEMVAVSKLRIQSIAEKHFQFISQFLLNTSTITNEYLLLNIDSSKQHLNQMFTNTYNYNYKIHQTFFYDFYDKLKQYTDCKLDNLQTILDNFFADMAERIVGMMIIAKKDPDTVRCLTNNLMKLDPYQGADKAISTSILGSYPLARMFVNSINAANDVFIDLIKDKTVPSWDCAKAYSKAFYCPLCSGSKAKPCDSLCKSTIGQCLGSLNPKEIGRLSKAWIKVMVSLENLSKKLLHPFNMPEVNKNLHVKISDAIMNLHNFFPNVREKIWVNCKSPSSRERRSSNWVGEFQASQTITDGQSLPNDVDLIKLVKIFSTKIPEMKTYLKKFKTVICDDNKSGIVDDTEQCWSGVNSSMGVSVEPKPKKNNRNSPIDPIVKKSINKLNEISSLLNLLIEGKNKDPRAFKIEFIPIPKKPAPRQGDDTVPTIEGSGDVDQTVPTKPATPVKPVEPNEEVIDGSGKSNASGGTKKNQTQPLPSFPKLPVVEDPVVATVKPEPVAKKPVITDDEDIDDSSPETNKNEIPGGPIEGSGQTDNKPLLPVLPIITTTTPVIIPTEVIRSRVPPIEGSGFDESPDDDIGRKSNNPEPAQFPVINDKTTVAPTTFTVVTTMPIFIPQELPGDIPQEIWIPRAMDYDIYGRLISITTKSCQRLVVRSAGVMLLVIVGVITRIIM